MQTITPPATAYLTRATGRVAYDVTGTGPLVVCLPGMGDLRSVYRFLGSALAQAGFRVATMDLRGHGESDTSFDAYDTVAAGADLVALVGHLGGPAVFVGNSMGAGAACWAAAEAPELCRGLVLVGPFVRNGSTTALDRLLFRFALVRPWGRAVWKASLRSLYPTRRDAAFDAHLAEVIASLERADRWRAFSATTQTSHDRVEARLSEVRAPTLVVMGEKDRDWPDPSAEARWIAERLSARTLMVAGAGHYPQAEFPEIVSPSVVEFVRSVTQRSQVSSTERITPRDVSSASARSRSSVSAFSGIGFGFATRRKAG